LSGRLVYCIQLQQSLHGENHLARPCHYPVQLDGGGNWSRERSIAGRSVWRSQLSFLGTFSRLSRGMCKGACLQNQVRMRRTPISVDITLHESHNYTDIRGEASRIGRYCMKAIIPDQESEYLQSIFTHKSLG
jgi:hypothetical protein